jgi:hypothetical protein
LVHFALEGVGIAYGRLTRADSRILDDTIQRGCALGLHTGVVGAAGIIIAATYVVGVA